MSRWETPARRRAVEVLGIQGHPTEEERRAIERVLEHIVAADLHARLPSVWLRAGRAQGRRLGMYDYRDRFSSEDAWRLSVRFPPGGRQYPGLWGRGDAR
jgi:hypothetical protein